MQSVLVQGNVSLKHVYVMDAEPSLTSPLKDEMVLVHFGGPEIFPNFVYFSIRHLAFLFIQGLGKADPDRAMGW